jgi:hypothetical protein
MPRILLVIVLAQFLCTSLWFAGNAIAADLAATLQQPPTFVAHLTSAVQLGFIAGTLVFALLAIATVWYASILSKGGRNKIRICETCGA